MPRIWTYSVDFLMIDKIQGKFSQKPHELIAHSVYHSLLAFNHQ